MILVLQTNVPGSLSAWLVSGRKVVAKERRSVRWHGSDRALTMVDRLLRKWVKPSRHISQIIVVRGPGPFTAVRTGLIIVNTLGQLWNIPVRGVVKKALYTEQQIITIVGTGQGQRAIVRPWYGKSPNISRPLVARHVSKFKPHRDQAKASR